MKNFTFGFLQVFLVSIQTWFIASQYFPGIAAGGLPYQLRLDLKRPGNVNRRLAGSYRV